MQSHRGKYNRGIYNIGNESQICYKKRSIAQSVLEALAFDLTRHSFTSVKNFILMQQYYKQLLIQTSFEVLDVEDLFHQIIAGVVVVIARFETDAGIFFLEATKDNGQLEFLGEDGCDSLLAVSIFAIADTNKGCLQEGAAEVTIGSQSHASDHEKAPDLVVQGPHD